jgi:hypothetical protein
VEAKAALAVGGGPAYSKPMTRPGYLGLCLCGAALAAGTLQAQSALNGQTATAVAGAATGVTGQGRGITAVTRRTLMGGSGQAANGFFAAGGVNLVATPAASVPAPAAPVVAANTPGLERPDVRAALQRLAASGNVEARQLLKPSAPSAATAAAASAR